MLSVDEQTRAYETANALLAAADAESAERLCRLPSAPLLQ
jgi:hypothetical protein